MNYDFILPVSVLDLDLINLFDKFEEVTTNWKWKCISGTDLYVKYMLHNHHLGLGRLFTVETTEESSSKILHLILFKKVIF